MRKRFYILLSLLLFISISFISGSAKASPQISKKHELVIKADHYGHPDSDNHQMPCEESEEEWEEDKEDTENDDYFYRTLFIGYTVFINSFDFSLFGYECNFSTFESPRSNSVSPIFISVRSFRI